MSELQNGGASYSSILYILFYSSLFEHVIRVYHLGLNTLEIAMSSVRNRYGSEARAARVVSRAEISQKRINSDS